MAWLAPHDDDIPLAFETLNIVYSEIMITSDFPKLTVSDGYEWDEAVKSVADKLKDFKWVGKYPSLCEDKCDNQLGNPRWQSIMDLTALHYWKRIWILQEVVLAKNLLYLSPSAIIAGPVFELATECLFEALSKCSMTIRPPFVSYSTWNFMVNNLGKAPPPAWLFNSFKADLESIKALPAHMISSFAPAPLRATDPRDYVYGLLGLMELAMAPDYNRHTAEIYCEFVAACIEKSRDSGAPYLNLAVSNIPTLDSTLQIPSWAPNLSVDTSRGPVHLAIAAAVFTEWGKGGDELFSSSVSDAEVIGKSLMVTGMSWETISVLSDVLDDDEILGNDDANGPEPQGDMGEPGPIAKFLQLVHKDVDHTLGLGLWPYMVMVFQCHMGGAFRA
ncbi:hypothetical protein ColLi_11504 [Colletotrichum liriopes]|uniref:Heterokaryon incompatibility domain-containing protein n=1 Tax=Colletotrichum liriopes TaxID=708192 RepID=A0AA37GWQ1_9PEZI|nr:hypothetical protein ColLi_11504 [Colletotrichum liriopes]